MELHEILLVDLRFLNWSRHGHLQSSRALLCRTSIIKHGGDYLRVPYLLVLQELRTSGHVKFNTLSHAVQSLASTSLAGSDPQEPQLVDDLVMICQQLRGGEVRSGRLH